MKRCPACGCDIAGHDKPRSLPQLRRFFAMIRAAFHHWPESCEQQFSSADDLRKYLTMRAGWRDIAARIPLVGVNVEVTKMIVSQAFKAAGTHAWPVVHKSELIIWVPRSISFHSMGPHEFGQLSDAVVTVIKDMTGLDAEILMKEHDHNIEL